MPKDEVKEARRESLDFWSSLLYMKTLINGDADLSPHAEPNELGLVEGLGDLPCEDGVHGADHHQEDWIAEGDHTNILKLSIKRID